MMESRKTEKRQGTDLQRMLILLLLFSHPTSSPFIYFLNEPLGPSERENSEGSKE